MDQCSRDNPLFVCVYLLFDITTLILSFNNHSVKSYNTVKLNLKLILCNLCMYNVKDEKSISCFFSLAHALSKKMNECAVPIIKTNTNRAALTDNILKQMCIKK